MAHVRGYAGGAGDGTPLVQAQYFPPGAPVRRPLAGPFSSPDGWVVVIRR
jgi:hypothetical protein